MKRELGRWASLTRRALLRAGLGWSGGWLGASLLSSSCHPGGETTLDDGAAHGSQSSPATELPVPDPEQVTQLSEDLRSNFDYLEIADADIQEYVIQYLAVYKAPGEARPGPLPFSAVGRENHFYTTFLMSSDFFLNGSRTDLPVRFTTLYHPYLAPCYNPLRA